MRWGTVIADLQASTRLYFRPEYPFIHRSLLVTEQVHSSAHFPSLSHPALTFLPEAVSPLLHPSPMNYSWPSTYIPSSVSFISPCHHICSQLILGSTTPLNQKAGLHFTLSYLLPQISSFQSISQFLYIPSFNLCLHTQSLCICIFAVPILSSLTTCILLEPALSSFLPLIHWHSYVSFTLSSKPYSCWLLLPNMRSTLPTTSPCSHLSLFFFLFPFP